MLHNHFCKIKEKSVIIIKCALYHDKNGLWCQNAACYCAQEDDDTEMGMDEDPVPPSSSGKSPGPPSHAGGLPPCFGRNMTFPRGHSAAYTVRHELPAVVTEGDAYRGHGEVRLAVKLILSNYEIVWRNLHIHLSSESSHKTMNVVKKISLFSNFSL